MKSPMAPCRDVRLFGDDVFSQEVVDQAKVTDREIKKNKKKSIYIDACA